MKGKISAVKLRHYFSYLTILSASPNNHAGIIFEGHIYIITNLLLSNNRVHNIASNMNNFHAKHHKFVKVLSTFKTNLLGGSPSWL